MSHRTSETRDLMKQTYQNDAFYNSSLSYKEDEDHQNSQNYDSPGQRQKTPKSHTPSNVNHSYTHQPDQGRHDNPAKGTSQNVSEADKNLATIDPFWELKQGKSEKEVLAHLKSANANLREELKKVSDDLTMLLEKKKVKKNNKASMPVKDIVNNEGKSEEVIATELKTAEKQLARLKKELDIQKSRFDNEGTFDKYEKLKEKVAEKDAKAQRIKDEKKALDKTIRETEKTLHMLCNEQETNLRINNLEQEVRLEREKLKEVEKRCELLKQHEARRKEYVVEIQNEIKTVKADIQKASTATHVNPDEIHKSHGEGQRVKTKENLGDTKTKKVPISKHLEPEPPVCNADNFDKLKKEIRILEKADDQRGKALEKKIEELREQLSKLTKQNEDANKKVAEKNKEILILQTKTKDISRIVRHHAVAPLQREERNLQLRSSSKELQDYTVAPGIKSRKAGDRSPILRDGKTTNIQQQAGVGESLTEYARKRFYAKGYRKDERGQLLPEGEGENWNDKDVVGKHKVKIIAIDIWHDDDVICGVQAVYEDSKGEVIEGPPHVMNPEACKMTTFETLEEDYVKEISGFMNKNETVVECLILKTYRGDSMKVGKPSKDSKFFRFDINELEYPAVLYGSVKEDKKTTRGRLTRLGVLVSAQVVEEVIKNEPIQEDEKKEENNESTVNKEKSDNYEDHNKSDLKSKKTNSEKNHSKNDVDQSRLSKGNKSGMYSKDGDEEEQEEQEEQQEEFEEGQDGEEEQQEEEYEEGEEGDEEQQDGEYEENDNSRRESNRGGH